jgi:hypothetical protein
MSSITSSFVPFFQLRFQIMILLRFSSFLSSQQTEMCVVQYLTERQIMNFEATNTCKHACMRVCVYVCMYVNMHACARLCSCVCMYVCMDACVDGCNVSLYVCKLCTLVWTYYTRIHKLSSHYFLFFVMIFVCNFNMQALTVHRKTGTLITF